MASAAVLAFSTEVTSSHLRLGYRPASYSKNCRPRQLESVSYPHFLCFFKRFRHKSKPKSRKLVTFRKAKGKIALGFSNLFINRNYSDVRRRSTTVPLLKKRRTMTGITAAKSRYTSAIINAGTKVKCSVKYHIEDEFKNTFQDGQANHSCKNDTDYIGGSRIVKPPHKSSCGGAGGSSCQCSAW